MLNKAYIYIHCCYLATLLYRLSPHGVTCQLNFRTCRLLLRIIDIAVLVYCCLLGLVPPYLASDLQRVADLDMWQHLRSASTPALVVPPSRLSTVGDRAFPVAAARVWNCLPDFITASTSLSMFK